MRSDKEHISIYERISTIEKEVKRCPKTAVKINKSSLTGNEFNILFAHFMQKKEFKISIEMKPEYSGPQIIIEKI